MRDWTLCSARVRWVYPHFPMYPFQSCMAAWHLVIWAWPNGCRTSSLRSVVFTTALYSLAAIFRAKDAGGVFAVL